MKRNDGNELELTPTKKRRIDSPTSLSLNEVTAAGNGKTAMDEDNYALRFSIPPFVTHHDIQEFVNMRVPSEGNVTKVELATTRKINNQVALLCPHLFRLFRRSHCLSHPLGK